MKLISNRTLTITSLVVCCVTLVSVFYYGSFRPQQLALCPWPTWGALCLQSTSNGSTMATSKLLYPAQPTQGGAARATQPLVTRTTHDIRDLPHRDPYQSPEESPSTDAAHSRPSYSVTLGARTETATRYISKVREAERDRSRRSFNERFVDCSASNNMNLSASIAESCSLKLRVNSVAEASLRFDVLDKKLLNIWSREPVKENVPIYSNSSVKVILLWIEKWPVEFAEGRSPFLKAGCPVNNCFLTTDRRFVTSEDVAGVVLHLWWILRSKVLLPERKDYPNARMILWANEAPIRHPRGIGRLSELVDYIASYRRDADIVRTRGSVFPITSGPAKDVEDKENLAANKTKMAAWFVSNCASAPSSREQLTKELQRHGVSVDIFGACGKFSCPRENSELCYEMLESQYKFYFSFENSLCNHYVTEKFYSILRYDVVPVTYGLGHELTGVPKDAYIDVFDFPSVEALALHLLYLDDNDRAYNQYFRWKKYYQFSDNFGKHNAFCELCAALNLGPAPQVPDKYRDIGAWYSDGQCIQVERSDRLRTFLGLP